MSWRSANEKWASVRQESSREEEARTQKPLIATLRVNESRPAELGEQLEEKRADTQFSKLPVCNAHGGFRV